MLIEEEADAVFNEIRNMSREMTINDDVASGFNEASKESKASSPTPIIINVNVLSTTEDNLEDKTEHSDKDPEEEEDLREEVELEEPVSPPSCHPNEGPPLLFSHCIEDLAAVIVNEKRQEEEEEVEEKPAKLSVPALIPLTVSEFAERPGQAPASVLHMSGGGVYTTDSYFGLPSLTVGEEKCRKKAAQTSVIKKLPLLTAAMAPAPTSFKKKIVINSKYGPAEEKQKNENVLWEFYKKSGLISEAKKTIKLSDGLEITPIVSVPSFHHPDLTQKRRRESTEIDSNESSKRARSDLVIEKIPRKNTVEEQSQQRDLATNEQSQQRDHTTNEQTLDCKLVVSTIYKKAKLVFENGTEVPISKNIIKHIIPFSKQAPAQSKRIRRKTVKTRKVTHFKVDSNLEKDTKIVEDDKTTGNPEPVVVEMPLIVDKDSSKTGIPVSYGSDNTSKVPAVGQHKLPSIVPQPSYHSWANRKIAMKSK